MFYHKMIPVWENTRRINKLLEFRELVVKYFSDLNYDYRGDPELTEESQKNRQKINLMLQEVDLLVKASGKSPVITYTPPPAIGGYIQNINIIHNIFNLSFYQITPINVLDMIDVARGIYLKDRVNSIIRTFNPFFWISFPYKWLVSLPIKLLENAGFNVNKIQSSFFGKILKLISEILTIFLTYLTIIQILGYYSAIDSIKYFLNNIF